MDIAVKPTCRPMPGLQWGQLLQRMAGGDEAALGTLYDEAGGMVFGLVRRVLRDEHDAEELTEEIFAGSSGFRVGNGGHERMPRG